MAQKSNLNTLLGIIMIISFDHQDKASSNDWLYQRL